MRGDPNSNFVPEKNGAGKYNGNVGLKTIVKLNIIIFAVDTTSYAL